jgi:lysophospholipase L1-like esterase
MWRKAFYSAIIFFVFLALLELAARVVEPSLTYSEVPGGSPGWQTRFFGTLFDWHEPDPDLLWRFKANLHNPLIRTNAEHLIGDALPAESSTDRFRILLLGDSGPVGLGLDSYKQAFGELTRYLLAVALADTVEVDLINAAVSGYSSEQLRRFLEIRGWAYNPDLVIVFCGNNDASISGAVSDAALIRAQRLRDLRRLLGQSAFYRLLRAMLSDIGGGRRVGEKPLRVRVAPERYVENLIAMSDECLARNCPLILLKPAVPRLWPAALQFKPLAHISGVNGQVILPEILRAQLGRQLKYCLSRERFAELYGSGDIFTRAVYASVWRDSMVTAEAVRYYQGQVASDSTDPVACNNLGVSLWELSRYEEADRYLKRARALFWSQAEDRSQPSVMAAGSPFLYNIGINLLSRAGDWRQELADPASEASIYLDSALQADYLSLRAKQPYLEAIDRLAARDGVIVIDLPSVFAGHGGEQLFVDHCHPTAEGHLLIARHLTDTIIARLF